jgi:hypothetical protein
MMDILVEFGAEIPAWLAIRERAKTGNSGRSVIIKIILRSE